MADENIIDLLTIENKQKRKEKFELVIKNAEEHQILLANAYMRLAEKNQGEDFKKHSRFLKIFPQYFAMNIQSFYDDPEIETIKKLLLDLDIKMNIFDHKKNVQACFWFMLFNFMTPINAEIEITTARRKILSGKYCTKNDPNSRTLQNIFRSLEKSGLLLKKDKNKQTTTYVVPLISATRRFTEAYTTLNLDYLNLLHETQTEAIQLGLKRKDLKVDPQKIKRKISEEMTDELIKKISYKNEKVRVKVTYEVECDSVSGEISYGNLVDIIDINPVKPIEKSSSSLPLIIEKFLQSGNSLKNQQIKVLIENDFELLAEEYKTDPVRVKKKIKGLPSIGRVTYRALSEFLSIGS